MQNTTKIAAFFVAASMSLAPVAATASVGDNVFSWPSNFSSQQDVKQDRVTFGTTQTLKSILPSKKMKKEKKQ